MSDLSRRRLLAATGTALTAAVAGCSSSDDEGGNGEQGDEPEESDTGSSTTDPEGTILGEITVDNLDKTSHTIDVLVEFDRTIETWETETLSGDSGTTLDRDWPTEPGRFRVTVRMDQGDPVQVTPANWNEPDCLNLFVRIDRAGELSVLSDTNGGPCGAGEAGVGDGT